MGEIYMGVDIPEYGLNEPSKKHRKHKKKKNSVPTLDYGYESIYPLNTEDNNLPLPEWAIF